MEQYRHEYKYQINEFDYIQLRSRLQYVMKRDAHIGESGQYRIRSLYFDTPSDKALREKEDGLSRRDKFRIRYYNDDLSFIRLEKKVKVSGLGTKISARLSIDESEKIVGTDIEWMSTDERDLVRELYVKMRYDGLRPKTVVDYIREPFIYDAGNVRVTFDRDIKSGNFATDFLSRELPVTEAASGTIIMEVKYDAFLPDVVRDIIQLGNREVGSFSKYVACRQYTV